MFVQVIQGPLSDEAGLRRQIERWEKEVRPGATGFLGTTAGVTDDGRSVAIARFESAEAARKNSERSEQTQWWNETDKLFDGVTFKESEDVEVALEPSNDAGFVQVMQGRVNNESGYRDFIRQHIGDLTEMRPDIVGDVAIYHGNGEYTEVIYFSSEAAAREGEGKMASDDAARKIFEELMSYADGEPTFFDLKNPIFQ